MAENCLEEVNKKFVSFAEKTFFSDKEKNARLEERMKLQHLEALMGEFLNFSPPDIVLQEATSYFPAKVQKRTPGAMNKEEFKHAVNKVIGTNEYDEYLDKLFQKLDTSYSGYVDWNEFCTYMLLLFRENDYMRTKREIPFQVEPKIRHIVQNKQEQTTKILASCNPCRYVTVSKEGVISVWMPNMSFERSYTTSEEEVEQNGPKRRFKMWVTDAIYMPNCHKLAIASTSRDIRFFDCSTNQWFEEFTIFAMSDVPYCFDYWYDVKSPGSQSVFVFGVDSGAIHILYFKKPLAQLFEITFKSEGGAQKIFWSEVEKGSHSRYVEHEKIYHDKVQQVPPNLIRQVQYIHEKKCIISSCSSANRSIVISDISKLKKPYVFNVDKGIECFDYSKSLNLVVTGSLDHTVRVWNAYVSSKPVATLEGHATGVIGCKVHEGLMQVFTYSKDAVVKVWDLREHTCVQTIVLKFPSSIHGRMPEHGQFPMHLQPSPQNALLVSCNDYLGMLKLGQTSIPIAMETTTHETQLCSAVYNNRFKQVVTGCDSSHIAVWELETGNKAIVFSNAHGNEEITCMIFDESWKRLITGARNGTIKVWNFQNGHNLHKLESVGEAEVTGIVPFFDQSMIIAVGWSRQIVTYDDSDPDNMYVPANLNWKGGQLHNDDILCVDHYLPYYIVTGGFDGEISVWDAETQKLFLRLRKGQKADITKSIEAIQKQKSLLGSMGEGIDYTNSYSDVHNSQSQPQSQPQSRPQSRLQSRPNSRHQKSHRLMKGQPVPVDKLLFLKARCNSRNLESSVLVSSEGGTLRWWALFGTKFEIGYFYAPDVKDESVLAMCTNEDNNFLVTGDTAGVIKVWNIDVYCIRQEDRRIKKKPPLLHSWKGHAMAVVSVDFIEHDTGRYIVSASTDKTARLWTLDGKYVGTFGQKTSWDLKRESTWCYPNTPWSSGEGGEENGYQENGDSEQNEVNGNKENFEQYYSDKQEKSAKNNATNTQTKVKEEVINKEVEEPMKSSIKLPPIRSQTIDLGSMRPERAKTFLGSKVAKQLHSMKSSRMDRRQRLHQDVNFNITQRYGKLCSPFQALKTKDFEEVHISTELPLSQRMINKGYSSNAMTEEMLINLDFSYGSPDTPLYRDGEEKGEGLSSKHSNPNNIPSSKSPDKSSTAGSRKGSNSRQISAVRKNNTFS